MERGEGERRKPLPAIRGAVGLGVQLSRKRVTLPGTPGQIRDQVVSVSKPQRSESSRP